MSILGTRHIPHANPCESICTQSTGDYVCRRCGRTIPEVANWNTMEKATKIEVKQRCKDRLAAIKAGANPGYPDDWQ